MLSTTVESTDVESLIGAVCSPAELLFLQPTYAAADNESTTHNITLITFTFFILFIYLFLFVTYTSSSVGISIT